MKYGLKVLGFIVAALSITILTSCTEDVSGNPAEGEGEGEGQSEGEGEGEGEGEIEYGALIVESDPIGASITLDSIEAGTTNFTFPAIEVGLHDLTLSMPGKVLFGEGCASIPCTWMTDLTKDGTKIAAKAYDDLNGTWKREVDGDLSTLSFFARNSDNVCPNTRLRIEMAGQMMGTREFCVEADGSLSLCANKGDGCDEWGTGQVLDNGQTIELNVAWEWPNPGEETWRFTKVVE
jgi:hypothetical protein